MRFLATLSIVLSSPVAIIGTVCTDPVVRHCGHPDAGLDLAFEPASSGGSWHLRVELGGGGGYRTRVPVTLASQQDPDDALVLVGESRWLRFRDQQRVDGDSPTADCKVALGFGLSRVQS